MSATYEQFVQNLNDLEIMTADEVRAFWGTQAEANEVPDSQKLAGKLFRAGKLTKYQAVRVYQNKHHGLLLGNYLILDQLGRGGMGEVFKARHRRMKRLVAIKVLSQSVTQSEQSRRRFQREVEAAAKLVHPNIVTAFDADEHKGVHFLVMEYVDGKDLGVWLNQRGSFTVAQTLDCIIQAARGLQFAHEAGVVHRDIKPQNMLLDRNGCIKILDMGLVSLEDTEEQDSSEDLTQNNQIMGSVDYMSPEQAEDVSSVDLRTDIYGLGCTLFRLLTGKPPYPGGKLIEKLVAHRQRPIPSLREHCPEVSVELDEVFQGMIAKDRDDRPDSMQEVIRALERCQGTGIQRTTDQQMDNVAGNQSINADTAFEVSRDSDDQVDADSAMLRFVKSLHDESPLDSPADDDSVLLEVIDDVVSRQGNEESQGSLPSREATVQKDGDSETMPELRVRRNRPTDLNRQWKGDKRIRFVYGLAFLIVIGLSVFAWYQTRQPQLVIDWPLESRHGVMVILNDQALGEMPRSNPVRINVERGLNRLEMRRRGFEWIEKEITVGKGQRVKVELDWIPIAFPGEDARSLEKSQDPEVAPVQPAGN